MLHTEGLLSSCSGLMFLLQVVEVIDPGEWAGPIIFKCQEKDIEPLRALLEESLPKEDVFDARQSAITVIGPVHSPQGEVKV